MGWGSMGGVEEGFPWCVLREGRWEAVVARGLLSEGLAVVLTFEVRVWFCVVELV
jgi:hypothetical protein